MIPEAKAVKLAGLVSLEAMCKQLDLTEVEVYWLMSTRKLPSYLIGPAWKFDKKSVETWIAQMGGLEAVRKDVKDQVARHQAGLGGTEP